MLWRLRVRVLRWLMSRRPTVCDECGRDLPRTPVRREWCSQECAVAGWERQQV